MTKEEQLGKYPIVANNDGTRLFVERRFALKAIGEYARHVVISFTNWTTSAECDYSCSDEDQWNNIHNPHESITTEQLYEKYIQWSDNQFVEQQNKDNESNTSR